MPTQELRPRIFIDEPSPLANCDWASSALRATFELLLELGTQCQPLYVGIRCGEPSFERPEYVRSQIEGND